VLELLGEVDEAVKYFKSTVEFEENIGHDNAERDRQYLDQLCRKNNI
jgi:hypothetical protein